MDKNVGLILDGLEKSGLADSTLVIYLGDQGYLLNEHGRFEKHTMWEESIKAPLIVQGGKTLQKGKKTDALVEFIDVAPTIFEAMGVAPLNETQGKSFLPVLTHSIDTHKNYVFAEYLEDNKAMVASPGWKYIFTTGKRDLGQGYETGHGPSGLLHKLYNLEKDPGETTNVAYIPENEEVLNKFQEKMLEIFKETHPYADEVPEGLTRVGQLIWFCEPRDAGETPMQPLERVFEAER
jgi:arylsulfatase A-like enzyme